MSQKAKINYFALDENWRKEEKLQWLRDNPLRSIAFAAITPDAKHNWLNVSENDFDTLLPLAQKSVKFGKSDEAICKLYSLGVSTNRDDWVIDVSAENLQEKMRFFIIEYEKTAKPEENPAIKWSRNLNRRFLQGLKEDFDVGKVKPTFYRPFVKKFLYYSNLFIDEKGNAPELFVRENKTILYRYGDRMEFFVIATDAIPNLNIFSLDPAQAVSLYRYNADGVRRDNITDWALAQFRAQYGDDAISKTDIFHYTYAVLHHPVYRQKYELNLKRDFPRLPFYQTFDRWAAWGKELMELHIGYESVTPWPLALVEMPDAQVTNPKPKLRADKAAGVILLDEVTRLEGVPPAAWEYKLGHRSALEWVLDQYKEKKPADPTIAAKFNRYRFADHKTQVIDLLRRVCAVSLRTQEIIAAMPA